jgi:hypothetical protein
MGAGRKGSNPELPQNKWPNPEFTFKKILNSRFPKNLNDESRIRLRVIPNSRAYPSQNLALQSQEIPNKPVFVLRNSEKVCTDSEN